jgi:uncharacterized protein YtpQ (UPF0354 family)
MGILDRFKREPPREAFVKEYIAALRRSGERGTVEFNDKEFTLTIKGADGKTANMRQLANCFQEYGKAPEDKRAAIVDNYVRAMAVPLLPSEWPSARSMLRPVLKDRGAADTAFLQQRVLSPTMAEPIPFQPLTSDLAIFPVLDLPDSMKAVSLKDLRDWGVSIEQVMEAALSNFRAANALKPFKTVGRLQVAQVGDSYDATRLLLTEQIAGLRLKGRPVALAAERELLILAGSSDEAALADMANLGLQRFKAGHRPVSGRPVELVDGTWRDFEPPASVAVPFGQLRRFMDHNRYEHQAELLRKDLAARNEDVFVAKYALTSKDKGVTFDSNVTWSENVVTLLPEADQLMFFQGASKTVHLSRWDRAVPVVAHRMERTEHYPPRWKVSSFPSPEEFAVMGAQKIVTTG